MIYRPVRASRAHRSRSARSMPLHTSLPGQSDDMLRTEVREVLAVALASTLGRGPRGPLLLRGARCREGRWQQQAHPALDLSRLPRTCDGRGGQALLIYYKHLSTPSPWPLPAPPAPPPLPSAPAQKPACRAASQPPPAGRRGRAAPRRPRPRCRAGCWPVGGGARRPAAGGGRRARRASRAGRRRLAGG
jgi:hypothetical protein